MNLNYVLASAPETQSAFFRVVAQEGGVPQLAGRSVRHTHAPAANTTAEKVKWACRQCGVTSTPERRNGPEGKHTLCNACGLRYRKVNKRVSREEVSEDESRKPITEGRVIRPRPVYDLSHVSEYKMKTARQQINLPCRKCGTTRTPEWRKGPAGPRTLCNACGLAYAKSLREQKRIKGAMSLTHILNLT